MSSKTESETAFEDACRSFKLKFEPIPKSLDESPDYKIYLSGNLVVAEVKQFDLNDEEKRALQECRTKGSSAYWPGEDNRIRNKIHEANSQLKSLTKNKSPGALVLFTGASIGSYDAEDIHAAMSGNESYNYAIPHRGSEDRVFRGARLAPNGRCKPHRHTTTSAVISLRRSGDQFTLSFFHNKFAKNPVQPDWLRGPGIRHFASKQADENSLPDWVAI